MNTVLGIAENDVRTADILGLTEDVAINAALYSGALGTVGGNVPLFGAVVGAAGQVNQMNKKRAEERAREAYQRRAVLTGMYAAKGCGTRGHCFASPAGPAAACEHQGTKPKLTP